METEISGLPCGVELVLRLSCLGPTVEGQQLKTWVLPKRQVDGARQEAQPARCRVLGNI
jgi:hypothetical protein